MRASNGPNTGSVASPGNPQGASPAALDSQDRLDSWKEIAAYLRRSVLTAQRWEKSEGLPVHRHTHERQASVYAFRSELDQWRRDREVAALATDPMPGLDAEDLVGQQRLSFPSLRGRGARVAAVATVVVVVASLTEWHLRATNVAWARDHTLPAIERLAGANYSSRNFLLAYRLGIDAERYIAGDAQLTKLWPTVSRTIDVVTEPAGAEFTIGGDSGSEALRFGTSPLRQIRVPRGFLRWRVRKAGYEPVEGMLEAWSGSLHVVLDPSGRVPAGMIRASGGKFELGMAHLGARPPFELTDYWIDRYEVTNREFKRFVDAGGYSDPKYWKENFSEDGRQFSFSDAMRLFRDRTGRPGPATWDAGDFPEGKGDYPVTGVSWFEAMAYARFVGKSLPTIFHWARAAGVWTASEVVPLSNFSGDGPGPVGKYRGMSVAGAYDMAGNVKEWCLNATAQGRFILGGAWNEPLYMASEADAQSPFSRAENFGFRLVTYIAPPAPTLLAAVDYPRRDFSKERPVSNDVFKVIRGFYAYDRTPLHATTNLVDDSNEHWRKETVSFDAAYGGERVIALLFVPRHTRPPYQTVVYFPGSAGIKTRSSRDLQPPWDGAIVKSGRALVIPVYKGTFERGDALDTDYPAQTDFYREHVLDWYRDLGRTLDYIETRRDLDASRIAYAGFSWGARLGPLFLALDQRLKAAALVAGGFKFARTFPEADPFNFAARVTVPVLMVNGRYDYFFPLETSQQPLLTLLGTPERDKRHVVLESGHAPPAPATVKEMLKWFDQYLGPVTRLP